MSGSVGRGLTIPWVSLAGAGFDASVIALGTSPFGSLEQAIASDTRSTVQLEKPYATA